MKTKEEVKADLREALITLAICCYSEDKTQQDAVKKVATLVSEALNYLDEEKSV